MRFFAGGQGQFEQGFQIGTAHKQLLDQRDQFIFTAARERALGRFGFAKIVRLIEPGQHERGDLMVGQGGNDAIRLAA